MAEFWYNSSYHTSLGCTPFKALYGIDLNFGTMPTLAGDPPTSLAELAADREDFLTRLREHLQRAQERIQAQADKRRKDREFAVGEHVLNKLQPYAQSSLVNRPCAKIALSSSPSLPITHKYSPSFRIRWIYQQVPFSLKLSSNVAWSRKVIRRLLRSRCVGLEFLKITLLGRIIMFFASDFQWHQFGMVLRLKEGKLSRLHL